MWAEVKNEEIVNLVEADAKFARKAKLVKVPDSAQIGHVRRGKRWAEPEREEPEAVPTPEETIRALFERVDALEAQLTDKSSGRSGGAKSEAKSRSTRKRK